MLFQCFPNGKAPVRLTDDRCCPRLHSVVSEPRFDYTTDGVIGTRWCISGAVACVLDVSIKILWVKTT